MTTKTEHIPIKEFQPDPVKFVDMYGLHDIYEGLQFEAPLICVGPKGIGKTLSFQSWAAKIKCPIVTFDCSEDVRRSHLIGMYVLRGDQTPFILGPIPTAFEIANEYGMCILAFEEVNALTPQMQKGLNSVADYRRKVEVPECQRVFKLKPGARLWVVGSMNTSVYGGVYQLNEDLKSRFRLLALDYPKPSKEKEVVQAVLNGNASKLDSGIIDKVLLLAHETRQKTLEYALSTRDVVQLLEDIAALDTQTALRIVIGKFDDSDRDTIVQRIQSIFGVQLAAKPQKKSKK